MSDRLLVMGDVHGAYRAMTQVLERANFDPTSDHLIFLGDVADGWSEVPQCIDLFLDIERQGALTAITGNHDEWLLEWAYLGQCVPEWYHQGGASTVKAYQPEVRSPFQANFIPHPRIPETHTDFLSRMKLYHWDKDRNMVFTHGGFDPHFGILVAPPGGYTWDRELWQNAKVAHSRGTDHLTTYSKVFIGHTATERESLEPVRRCEIWNLDQGAGWFSRLSLMDADTEEYWQSDLTGDLYAGEKRRRG